MLGVVAVEHVAIQRAKLGRGDPQALALEAADDLAHKAALDRVGLAYDQRAIHDRDATAHPR